MDIQSAPPHPVGFNWTNQRKLGERIFDTLSSGKIALYLLSWTSLVVVRQNSTCIF
jgi:hypothetical protein